MGEKALEELLEGVPAEHREQVQAKYQQALDARKSTNSTSGLSELLKEEKSESTQSLCRHCQQKKLKPLTDSLVGIRPYPLCDDCQAEAKAREQEQQGKQEAAARLHRATNLEHLLRCAGVPRLYLGCRLSSWKGEKPQHQPVYISGAVGVGKTHLAVGYLAQYLVGVGNRGGFIEASELYRQVKASFKSGQEGMTEMNAVWTFQAMPFLVVDDLGAEYLSEFGRAFFYDCINARHGAGLGPQTIITSNLGLAELTKAYHPRMASRIAEWGAELHIKGKDHRFKGHVREVVG